MRGEGRFIDSILGSILTYGASGTGKTTTMKETQRQVLAHLFEVKETVSYVVWGALTTL